MARYKSIDTSPRFIAVDLQRQLVPGTFEHALDYLVIPPGMTNDWLKAQGLASIRDLWMKAHGYA